MNDAVEEEREREGKVCEAARWERWPRADHCRVGREE